MTFSARLVAFARYWLFPLVAFGLLAGPASADQRLINGIVVFGDSLSDPGNALDLNGGVTVSPPTYGMDGRLSNGLPEVITLIPDAPYKSGRFSDGRTWIEVLGAAAGFPQQVKPAAAGALIGPDGGKAANYAVGGARAAGTGRFDLGGQVGLFLSDTRGHAPADSLYVVAIGGNDIRDALEAEDPGLVIGTALRAVSANIVSLYMAGARKFVLWNVPNLGRAPALQRLDGVLCPTPGCVVGPARAASEGYNAGLAQVVLGLRAALPGIEILPFDTFGTLEQVVAHPEKFGLLDAKNACIQPNVPQFGFPSAPPFRCAQPDRFLFWDGIHPTRAGHAIIAFMVGKALLMEALQND